MTMLRYIQVISLVLLLSRGTAGSYADLLWHRSSACNVRVRQSCISYWVTANACSFMGCCYRFTLYAPSCYHPNREVERTATTIAPRAEPRWFFGRNYDLTDNVAPTTTTTTTTTRAPTTTTQLVSGFITNGNNPRKQSRPDPLVAAFLAQLARQSTASRNKQEGTSHTVTQTTQGRRPQTTPAVFQVSASAVIRGSEPVSRGVREFGSNNTGQEPSNSSPIQTFCDYGVDREDCGFPGITETRCRDSGCCWDNRDMNLYWCFYATSIYEEDGEEYVVPPPFAEDGHEETPTGEDLLPGVINQGDPSPRHEENHEELVEPPTPTESPSTSQPRSLNVGVNQYTADEQRFLSLVEQEISGLGPLFPNTHNTTDVLTTSTNAPYSTEVRFDSTIPTTTTTRTTYIPTLREITEPIWLQQLLNLQTSLTTNPTTTAIPTTTSTTTRTTTTTGDMLPPYTDRFDNTERNQNEGDNTVLGPLVPSVQNNVEVQSLEEIAAFLKLLSDLERQRQHLQSSNQHVCELDERDACCRLDPTAPCCEFQVERDLAHRAAPMTRIVGGGPAGDLRYSVAYLSKLPFRSHFCGGTLIDNDWVLTAAHCVLEYCHGLRPTSDLLVSLGKYRKYYRDEGQQDIGISDVICHHNHCKSHGQPRLNDLALLRLARPAYTTEFVTPAFMPTSFEAPTPNRNCIVLGWGSTRGSGYANVLKEVSVPLVANQQCNRPEWRNCVIRACMMCAGDINIDPCDGDSGGPLFCPRSNGLYVLHGIYSWGRCGSEYRKPAVYTRASYFIDWIARVTQTFIPRT